ncbi:LysR family transcriptional regulator [Stakelama sp. CBK3Z-3]|uniref:LysR family transcriptional regulator n=1 Tax=Stakelama flava TaxID=2860338 RepID=A0ABS6XRD4_9SPHN|nr:LysR family transcriptional regulator [Stakelama flava]MBW4332353.1 LysR family transcriptional regulator [Stakelama flava]
MQRDIDLTALRTFQSVVEAHSLTGAAKTLGLAKSVVSNRIATLEKTLGVSLFDRGRRLVLTDRGRLLYEGARSTLEDFDILVASVSKPGGTGAGRFRITLPAGLGVALLGDVLAAFFAKHPGIDLELNYADAYVDLISEGFDLGLRVGQPSDVDLIGRRICKVDRVVCASPAYLAGHGKPASLADLRNHAVIGYSLIQDQGQWAFEGASFSAKSRGVPRPSVITNNGHAMRAAALAGLGLMAIPRFFVSDDFDAGRLCEISLNARPVPLELWALYPRRREQRPLIGQLIAYIKAALSSGL